MKAIVVNDVELNALLDRLELKKFQSESACNARVYVDGKLVQVPPEMIEAAHRYFHYHVVRWIQEVGGEVRRS